MGFLRHRDVLLAEFDRETGATRRLLACAPDGRFEWRPHPRSRSLGELATHMAELPGWVAVIATTSGFDLPETAAAAASDANVAAVLARYDRHVANARKALLNTSDAELEMRWTLSKGGHPLLVLPRNLAIRVQLLGHLIHHRGQLTVYLRLLDVPLPPIYGPTADG